MSERERPGVEHDALPSHVLDIASLSLEQPSEEVLCAREAAVQFDLTYQGLAAQEVANMQGGFYRLYDVRDQIMHRRAIPPRDRRRLAAPLLANPRIVMLGRIPDAKCNLYVRPCLEAGETDPWDDVERFVAYLETQPLMPGLSMSDCMAIAREADMVPTGREAGVAFRYLFQGHPRAKIAKGVLQKIISHDDVWPPRTIGEAADIATTSGQQKGSPARKWEHFVFGDCLLAPDSERAFKLTLDNHPHFYKQTNSSGEDQYFIVRQADDINEAAHRAEDAAACERLSQTASSLIRRIIDEDTVTLHVDHVMREAEREAGVPLTETDMQYILDRIHRRSRLVRIHDLFVEEEPPTPAQTALRPGGFLINLNNKGSKAYQDIQRVEAALAAYEMRRRT